MYGPYSYVNVSSLSTPYSYPLSIQTRTYAKGKDKKKEKGIFEFFICSCFGITSSLPINL